MATSHIYIYISKVLPFLLAIQMQTLGYSKLYKKEKNTEMTKMWFNGSIHLHSWPMDLHRIHGIVYLPTFTININQIDPWDCIKINQIQYVGQICQSHWILRCFVQRPTSNPTELPLTARRWATSTPRGHGRCGLMATRNPGINSPVVGGW